MPSLLLLSFSPVQKVREFLFQQRGHISERLSQQNEIIALMKRGQKKKLLMCFLLCLGLNISLERWFVCREHPKFPIPKLSFFSDRFSTQVPRANDKKRYHVFYKYTSTCFFGKKNIHQIKTSHPFLLFYSSNPYTSRIQIKFKFILSKKSFKISLN